MKWNPKKTAKGLLYITLKDLKVQYTVIKAIYEYQLHKMIVMNMYAVKFPAYVGTRDG